MVELGIGYYTPAEAGRLLHLPSRKIRRWLGSQTRPYRGGVRRDEPLWTPEIVFDDGWELSFRDLMELRFIHEFREHGISIQMLRKALPLARKFIGDYRPMSNKRFRTDGRNIFVQVFNENGEPKELLDLVKGQYVFREIVEPAFKGIEFRGDQPERWMPWSSDVIVVDPRRSFGQPILDASGIPTVTLASEVKAEGSIDRVAYLFDVPPEEVLAAVEFERKLAA